ncbi:MAG: OsmC family protein [Candidatus Promineifilaceae bacterium]|nr:OsmC family protein [Candidatus Promineifilaceae bacterium]
MVSGQTNKARVVWSGEELNFTGHLGSGYHFELGGGENKVGGSPMEFLLAGAAGCTAVDVVMILQKQRQHVSGVEVAMTGKRAETMPKVYTEIDLVYLVRGDQVDPKAVERAISLSKEKYCSATAMLQRGGVKINTSYHIEQDD